MPSTIPCSVSPLISHIHFSLFWRCTVLSKFFGTQVSSISTKELVLPRHACCILSCLRCNRHSFLLGFYFSRIGRIENPFCSACKHSSQDTSHLILHCSATDSLATLCLSTTSGPGPGELPGFWGSMIFRHAPIPQKDSGNQQQQQHDLYLVYFVTLILYTNLLYKQNQINHKKQCKTILQLSYTKISLFFS